jgi:hypothetical protein
MNGKFTESTVKELMVDLRELARAAPNIGLEDPKFKENFSEFVEICDFIVHSNRNKGSFETRIRQQAERMADALSSSDESLWQQASKIQPAADIDRVVTGMLSAAFLVLLIFDKSLSKDFLLKAYTKKAEISLCIISLLQDSTIKLKNDHGYAVLHIIAYRGFFRLYCKIHESKLHKETRARSGGTAKLAIGFPVLITSSIDSDYVLAQSAPDVVTGPNALRPPVIYETFRAPSGKLCVRPLNV